MPCPDCVATAGPLQPSLSGCTCVWNSKPIIFPLFKDALLNNLDPFLMAIRYIYRDNIQKERKEKKRGKWESSYRAFLCS
jgi:hypothetical protein